MAGRRYIDLFCRLNHFPKMQTFLRCSNVQFRPFENLMGISSQPTMRLGGNLSYRLQFMSSKISARLMQMQQVLDEAESRAEHANQPVPKVTLEHVTVGFARSGGPGGQNVNKVLPNRKRIESTVMGTLLSHPPKLGPRMSNHRDNIDDALGKLQAIIDAAAYVPPAPTDEKIKKIKKMAEIGEQKRLQTKKVQSLKKAGRRSKGSWD